MNRRKRHFARQSGGTITDVVAVLVVIGVLVSLSIPMVVTARDRSSRYHCSERLRQLGAAWRVYTHDYGSPPCTRPSNRPLPDVSNSGFAAIDPFDPAGPAGNVPSILFLLVRTGKLRPTALVCPNTEAFPDDFGGLTPSQRSNFSDTRRNLSYGVQNPFASPEAIAKGFRWGPKLPDGFVIAADKGPGDSAVIPPNSPEELIREANSNNHFKRGQNVLYADGRVEFETSPFVGIDGDNIYTSKNNKVIDSPQDATDTVLLPPDGPTTRPADTK